MKCHYIYVEECPNPVFIPGCIGAAAMGPHQCTCRNRILSDEEIEAKEDKKLIRELEKENAQLNRIIKKLLKR